MFGKEKKHKVYPMDSGVSVYLPKYSYTGSSNDLFEECSLKENKTGVYSHPAKNKKAITWYEVTGVSIDTHVREGKKKGLIGRVVSGETHKKETDWFIKLDLEDNTTVVFKTNGEKDAISMRDRIQKNHIDRLLKTANQQRPKPEQRVDVSKSVDAPSGPVQWTREAKQRDQKDEIVVMFDSNCYDYNKDFEPIVKNIDYDIVDMSKCSYWYGDVVLVGVQHRDFDYSIISKPDTVSLVNEPENEHDAKAIAVMKDGEKLGYIPRNKLQEMIHDWESRGYVTAGLVAVDETTDLVKIYLGFWEEYTASEMIKQKIITKAEVTEMIKENAV